MTGKDTSVDPGVTRSQSQRPRKVEELESVVIRFAGDSGDGMQLTGTEFSKSIASGGY